MSDKEKRIIEAVAEALPGMSEFDKGYMLGIVESTSRSEEKKTEADAELKGA